MRNIALEDIVKWAAENGFEALEVACVYLPTSERVKGGINANNMGDEEVARIKKLFADNGIMISSLANYQNNLDPDKERRERYHEGLKKAIEAAQKLEVESVGTFVGRDPNKTIDENIELFKSVFPEFVNYAEERGVKLVIENCPMEGWQKEGLAGNIAYSPDIWEEMFEAIPNDNFGLNLDPSHLYWLGVDYIQAVKDFADRILHTHAKDTEIMYDKQAWVSILSRYGRRWWRYRIPGLGEIDWTRFVSTLVEVGYDGVLSIEHEDPVWEGEEEKVKKGLILGKRHLAPLLM